MPADQRASTQLLFGVLLCGALACGTRPVNSRVLRSDPVETPAGPATDAGRGAVRQEPYPAPPDAGEANDGPAPASGFVGAPCQRADQCESRFCVDGACCNVACGGSCLSCNLPGRAGDCSPVPAGQEDPRGGCAQDGAGSCGGSGFCNGQGGCAKYPPGTACGLSTCSGPRTFVPAGECDGDGTCVKGEAVECAPFTCEAGNCRFSCTQDSDCAAPNVCSEGKCGLRGLGQTCSAGEQCLSGFCVDGVCCENACTGRCQYCASPSARGTCGFVRSGAPDPRAAAGVGDPARVCLDEGVASCRNNGRCDGRGGCLRYPDGTMCRQARCEGGGVNAEFGPSFCAAGACASPPGTGCAPYRGCAGARCLLECSSDNRCVSGFFCNDDRCGKQVQGGDCEENTDCVSGFCAQGVCCNEACSASCRACDLDGSVGICSAQTFSEDLDVDSDQITSGEIEFFNDGDPVPPGLYTIRYLGGCIRYQGTQGWTVNNTDQLGFFLVGATTAERKLLLPGNFGSFVGMGGHADFEACEAAGQALPPVTFTHPGGVLGVALVDSILDDNEPGEDDINPAWLLSGTLTCP